MYGAITKYPIFVLSESQKERKKENGKKKKKKKIWKIMADDFLHSTNYINLQIRKWENYLNRYFVRVHVDGNIKTHSVSLGTWEM